MVSSWYRAGQELEEGGRYSMAGGQEDPLTWAANLTLANLSTRDYGQYGCRAHNQWGAAQGEVVLGPPGPPAQPAALRVLSSTFNSVILAWQPGFDGGSRQKFR